MNNPDALLQNAVAGVAEALYAQQIDPAGIKIDKTPPEFAGERTVVVFPFTKMSRKDPATTAQEIGEKLLSLVPDITAFNVVKGFLNVSFSDAFWMQTLLHMHANTNRDLQTETPRNIVVEYCGPNTNKPLHLGHVRNILLGHAVSNILEAAGNTVHRVNILNDRGIAICKSMVAYQRSGAGKTPASTGIKGDHFVGDYYVEYSKIFDAEVAALVASGMDKEEAAKKAPIYLEAVESLRKWEAGDAETLHLWETMNAWVLEGFKQSYADYGIAFEKEYKESEYYVYGKQFVLDGLQKGVFFQKEDKSIWVDLTAEGLDEKVLLRSDGTSVYITQDIGVIEARYTDFHMDMHVYTVANEQDYHFKVLKLIMQKLGEPFADSIFHLSYGMVDLPEGKMKSREGTVVDADDLVTGMVGEAGDFLRASEKSADMDAAELDQLAKDVGMAALKYFILKVDPKKRMLFNPKESIDLHGNTGPFIQYTYARIRSILRKAGDLANILPAADSVLLAGEKNIIVLLERYPSIIQLAANNFSPAELANYLYELARAYNQFYAEYPVLKADTDAQKTLRLAITHSTSTVLQHGLGLLGIAAPERM